MKKIFSVRSVVSEAFSTLFSTAALPLVAIIGLVMVFVEVIKPFKSHIKTNITNVLNMSGHSEVTLFWIVLVGAFFFLMSLFLVALFEYINRYISLLIIDKQPVTRSNIYPSLIILMRLFCAHCILFLIVILSIAPSILLIIISMQFDIVLKSVFIVVSAFLASFGIFSIFIRMSMTSYFLVENTKVIAAFKNSWSATKGYTLKIFGVSLLLFCISIFVTILFTLVTQLILKDPLWLLVILNVISKSFFSAAYYLAFARIYRLLTSSNRTDAVVE